MYRAKKIYSKTQIKKIGGNAEDYIRNTLKRNYDNKVEVSLLKDNGKEKIQIRFSKPLEKKLEKEFELWLTQRWSIISKKELEYIIKLRTDLTGRDFKGSYNS